MEEFLQPEENGEEIAVQETVVEEDIVEEVEEEVVAIATEVAEPEADAINPEDDSTDEE